ncbi:MAG: hypothetical protein J0M04_19085 [Verrucomicrobia bacterium]|nr:hypothetical protein [Verrucomicrobiota bacterium]
MKSIAIVATVILAALSCSAKDIAWTYVAEEGEDATSFHYYFYLSDGSSIERIRWVWNGGAQNAPTVTEYILDSGRITIRELVGKRESVGALCAGKEADLELKEEYSILAADTSHMLIPPQPDQSLTARQRIDLKNIIDLLAKERKPFTKQAEQAAAGQPATRPKTKSEGNQKPQPRSKGRSR